MIDKHVTSEWTGSDLWNRVGSYSGNTFCTIIQFELSFAASNCLDMILYLKCLMNRDHAMKYDKTASFQISES
jgi:hypothetical protein